MASHLPRALTRAVAALLVLLACVLLPGGAASAHASLESTTPSDGSVVQRLPSSLEMQFSEGVSLRPDGVRVLAPDGKRVDRGAASSSGSVVTVPLRRSAAQGTYVVAWRVVSADGHPVRGAFTFSVGRESAVGSGAADGAFSGGSDRTYEVVAALARIVAYAATLIVCGYVVVAGALRAPGDPSPVGRRTTWGAVVGLVAMALQVPLQGALATGTGLGSVLDPSVLGLALADGMGIAALVTALGLVAVIVTAGLPWDGAVRKVALAGAWLAPLGFVLTGHTRTMSPLWLGYLADAAHLLAAAIWLGGLVATVVAVGRRRDEGDPLGAAEAVARFSGWAAVTAGAVVVAGGALAWIEVGGLHALTTTTYGRLLLAKVAIVLVVVAIAAWNRFRLVPRVAAASLEDPARDDEVAWRSLTRLMRIEVVALVVVLVLTGVLANVTPAKAADVGGPVTVSAPLGEGTVDITVDPARAGRNDVHAYVLTKDGKADDRYRTATMQLELPAQDIGPIDRTPVRAGPGHFQLVATPIAPGGRWKITFTVKPDRFTEQSATVSVEIR
ncbi:MAG: copper resistance protein CopC [Acidimicrobiales bacterium]